MNHFLVTGGAGFIGSHLCDALLRRGDVVACLDDFNDYYDPQRKEKNVAPLLASSNFTLVRGDIRNAQTVANAFEAFKPTHVAHLAAMAGPRPSIQKPLLYEDVNVHGTTVLLEASVKFGVKSFFLASTSSVYGRSPTPWNENALTDKPLSPYAATKKSAEVIAHAFHSAHGLPTKIARFFTVYGPKGRPDMTPHLFVDAMVKRQPITLFEGGHGVFRDWTYVDDIVAGVVAALDYDAGYEIFNLGNSQPVELIEFVKTLERVTGLEATIESKPLPAADPPTTYADTAKAKTLLGFEPHTPLETGLTNFWSWYQSMNL